MVLGVGEEQVDLRSSPGGKAVGAGDDAVSRTGCDSRHGEGDAFAGGDLPLCRTRSHHGIAAAFEHLTERDPDLQRFRARIRDLGGKVVTATVRLEVRL